MVKCVGETGSNATLYRQHRRQVVISNCTTHETGHHAAFGEEERLHMILVRHGDST